MNFKVQMAGKNYTHHIGRVYSDEEIMESWNMEGSNWDGTASNLNDILIRDNEPEWWMYLEEVNE